MRLLVTLGTEGVTNWVRMPDGQKFNLGSVSVLNFVTKLALGGSREARSALDAFLKGKEVMLQVDEDKMWGLLVPHRVRWAFDSFMTEDHRKRGINIMAIGKDLGVLEAHVQKLHQAAAAKISAPKLAEGVGILVRLAKSVGSDDSAYYGLDQPDEASDPEPKIVKLAYDLHRANSTLASQTLDQMEAVNGQIDSLVTAGKKFNATKAKSDVLAVTTKVAGIVSDVDLTVPWVADDLQKLAARADQLYGLFFPKK